MAKLDWHSEKADLYWPTQYAMKMLAKGGLTLRNLFLHINKA